MFGQAVVGAVVLSALGSVAPSALPHTYTLQMNRPILYNSSQIMNVLDLHLKVKLSKFYFRCIVSWNGVSLNILASFLL